MNIDKELENLFDDPLLNITDTEAALFDIPKDMQLAMKHRKKADYVAQYRPCPNFDDFKPLFEKVHAELKQGKRSLVKIGKTASLQEGHFYVIDGVIIYLESLGELAKSDDNRRLDGRTHCVLENGTETDILLQTLRKNVVGNGFGITEVESESSFAFANSSDMNDGDQETGYIYVLSSLSSTPQIASQKDLYKIGFTTQSVQERIANAENEPTYLMAPVKIEASYKIVNMNSQLFESLIHQILDAVQMQITVYDHEGKEHHPKEWFVVPLAVINTIIMKIMDGSITKYTYNPSMQCLETVVKKTQSHFNLKGLKVLTLNIKKVYFDEIMNGDKDIEYRDLKQTTLNKYTYIDNEDGKRYLRWYDVIHFFVGYNKDRESAIVEVKDITYNEGIVKYHLGIVLECIQNK